MNRDTLLELARALAVGVGIAVALVVFSQFTPIRFHPVLTPVLGLAIGALAWGGRRLVAPETPHWEQPSFHQRSPLLQSDVRTRRLALMLANSQPGKGFDAARVARELGELAARKLVLAGKVPDDDPLGHADGHLSPALLTYLRSAETRRPQALSRKILHAHLKEIDSL